MRSTAIWNHLPLITAVYNIRWTLVFGPAPLDYKISRLYPNFELYETRSALHKYISQAYADWCSICFSCCSFSAATSFLLMYHWKSISVIQERAAHAIRMPKFLPTNNQWISMSQKKKKRRNQENPLASILRSKHDRSYRLRDVKKRRPIAVTKYTGQHVDWVNAYGNICWIY
jgi:hypothetical protein